MTDVPKPLATPVYAWVEIRDYVQGLLGEDAWDDDLDEWWFERMGIPGETVANQSLHFSRPSLGTLLERYLAAEDVPEEMQPALRAVIALGLESDSRNGTGLHYDF